MLGTACSPRPRTSHWTVPPTFRCNCERTPLASSMAAIDCVRTQAQSQSFSACPIFSSASISSGLGSESLNSAGSDATNFVV
jgi:hypothetical protein